MVPARGSGGTAMQLKDKKKGTRGGTILLKDRARPRGCGTVRLTNRSLVISVFNFPPNCHLYILIVLVL